MKGTDMTEILPSYLQGSWWSPAADAEPTEVRDASTGEIVARVSTEGIDLSAALAYARTAGQASLGELTFHQRAVRLKQLALALTERKAELYETAKNLDVEGRSQMTKDELAAAVTEQTGGQA